MPTPHRTPPSFFLVPDEKINYEDTVRLGNILYRISEPDNVLTSHPLSTPPSSKTLSNYRISNEASKTQKIGLFTKILELLGFGINASSRRAKSDQEAYTIESMTISTFTPSKDYLKAVEVDDDVQDTLRNTPDASAFLITGVVLATGVTFTSSTSREAESEGSAGISSSGLSLGPSASRSRKNVLELGYTDAGPVVLAYRVQKLAMLEGTGKMGAEKVSEGAYFGAGDEVEMVVGVDVELDEVDTEEFERVEGLEVVDGVKYALWVAS